MASLMVDVLDMLMAESWGNSVDSKTAAMTDNKRDFLMDDMKAAMKVA